MVETLSIRDTLRRATKQTHWYAAHGSIINGLATGFDAIDEATWGLPPGHVTVVAGEPQVGKAAFARGVALHNALTDHKRVLWISLVADAIRFGQLLIAGQADLDVAKLRTGALSPEEWLRHDAVLDAFDLHPELDPRVQPSLGDMGPPPAPMWVVAGTDLVLADAVEAIARVAAVDLVVVDGLDRLAATTLPDGPRTSMDIVLEGLRAAAARRDAHLLCTLHVHPTWPNGSGHVQRRDFRDVPEVLRRANVLMALRREELHDNDTPNRGILDLELLVNEVGPLATVQLAFLAHSRKVANLVRGPGRQRPRR